MGLPMERNTLLSIRGEAPRLLLVNRCRRSPVTRHDLVTTVVAADRNHAAEMAIEI